MKLDKWTTILIVSIVVIAAFVWLAVQNKWFVPRQKLNLYEGEGEVKTDNGKVSAEYTRIAQNAHDSISGVNWNIVTFGEPLWADVVNQLHKLNNNELRIVVNEYDRLFDDSTLRSLLASEWTGCSKGSYFNSPNCEKYFEVMDRLNSINA